MSVPVAKWIRYAIGAVWFANGLFAKVLGQVPRHEEIVERILGGSHAPELTKLIGFAEMAMALWVWSGVRARVVAYLQIGLVLTMNILEAVLASDLLLWGPLNLLWAILFCAVIWWQKPSRIGGSR